MPTRSGRDYAQPIPPIPPVSFRFMDMPAELRNMVYGLVVNSPEPYIIKRDQFIIPEGILFASRQALRECLDVFLKQNEFILFSDDADISPIFMFMRALRLEKGDPRLKEFKFKIFLHGNFFPSKTSDEPFRLPSKEDWEVWTVNIQYLKEFGFQAKNVKFLPWLPAKIGDGPTLGWNQHGPGETGYMKALFQADVMPRILQGQDFFHQNANPDNGEVLRQVEEEWERLGLKAESIDEINRYRELYGRNPANIYPNYLRSLINDRNDMVEKANDLETDLDMAIYWAGRLMEFDQKFGACINRPPEKMTRLFHSLLFTKHHPETRQPRIPGPSAEEINRRWANRTEDEVFMDTLHEDQQLESRILQTVDFHYDMKEL